MRAQSRGFTLIELLVVLVIIGIMTAISLPALKGIGQSNTMSAATRQLMDDLALARHKAITGRTTAYMLFVPRLPPSSSSLAVPDRELYQRLVGGAFTTYAIFIPRVPGDQPGQGTRRYLTKWRELPEGVLIPPWQLRGPTDPAAPVLEDVFPRDQFPFPRAGAAVNSELPYIAFDQNGRLIKTDGTFDIDRYLWLTKGSVLPEYDKGLPVSVDVRENPPNNWTNNYNRIVIDAVTGRAKVERLEIQ